MIAIALTLLAATAFALGWIAAAAATRRAGARVRKTQPPTGRDPR